MLKNLLKREGLVVFILLFLLVTIFTFPLLFHMQNSTIAAEGDPLLNTWILSWDTHALLHSPADLFQANAIYASPDMLAFSEHLLSLDILATPIIVTTRNPLLAYNFLLFFGLVFSGLGAYLLIKYLTGSRYGAFAGAVFFALCPYKISQLSHLQICFTAFLPLLLLYLHKFLDAGLTRHLALFGLFYLAQVLASWYYMIFASTAVVLLLGWKLLWERGERKELLRRLGKVAVGGAAVAALTLPFVLPYLRHRNNIVDFARPMHEVVLGSARLTAYRSVLQQSLFYGRAPGFAVTTVGSENVLFPGFVIVLLAAGGLVAAFLSRKRKPGEEEPGDPVQARSFHPDVSFYLLLAGVAFIFSLGPYFGWTKIPLPFLLFYKMGIFGFIRAPIRFSILVFLSLAVLAGYGVARLESRVRTKARNQRLVRAVAVGVIALLATELMVTGLPMGRVKVWGEVPLVYTWLREQPSGVVWDAPFQPSGVADTLDRDLSLLPVNVGNFFGREALSMYYSTFHWNKLVNGYSGYIPYHYRKTVVEMQDFPSARSVRLLQAMGVNYVVWHWDWVPETEREEMRVGLAATEGIRLAADFGTETVYETEATGESAGREVISVTLAAPEAALPGSEANLSLLLRNTGDRPFVNLDETPFKLDLLWEPVSGGAIVNEPASTYPVFYLAPGESASFPFSVPVPQTPGAYSLLAVCRQSALGAFELGPAEITVGKALTSRDAAATDGILRLAPCASGEPEGPSGGILATTLEAENTGRSIALATTEDGTGTLRLGATWLSGSAVVDDTQRCTLPSDLAPGQTVALPVLLRCPGPAGLYTLRLQLVDEGLAWIGPVLQLQVRITAPPGASP